MRVLQSEVSGLNKELEELKAEWEEYKKPINDEIQDKKQEMQELKIEYGFKAEKIKAIKKQIKDTIQELEHKKKTLIYMDEEFSNIPKDINRNQYLKRINEIICSLKMQKKEIGDIL